MHTSHENPVEIRKFNIEYYHMPTGALKILEIKKDVFSVLEEPMSGKEDRPTRSHKGVSYMIIALRPPIWSA